MNTGRRMLVVGTLAGLGWFAGCSSSDHDHDRGDRRGSRDYDPGRYDRRYDDRYDARQASDRGPWRDEDGRLHHNPDWKSASDRGRDDNDRDDPSRRGY